MRAAPILVFWIDIQHFSDASRVTRLANIIPKFPSVGYAAAQAFHFFEFNVIVPAHFYSSNNKLCTSSMVVVPPAGDAIDRSNQVGTLSGSETLPPITVKPCTSADVLMT